MKLIVDRIEENIAVCETEDLTMVERELSALPEGTKAGSVIVVQPDGSYVLDISAENERKKKLFDLQNSFFDE